MSANTRSLSNLIAAAVAAVFLFPGAVQAAQALFQPLLETALVGAYGYSRSDPTGWVTVGTGATPSVVVPGNQIQRFSTIVVPTTAHYTGYPLSTRIYSNFNAAGTFLKSNPNAATTTTTIMAPATTTAYAGAYATPRFGTITVTPGPNRFGGTLRHINGPNAGLQGQKALVGGYYNFQINQFGIPGGVTSMEPQTLGKTHVVATNLSSHTTLTTGGGAPITQMGINFSQTAPWTTGTVAARNTAGYYPGTFTGMGYDNRTALGLNGNLSLVTPHLLNGFIIPAVGAPLVNNFAILNMVRRYTFTFVPEPGQAMMLAAGALGMVGMVGIRRLRRN